MDLDITDFDIVPATDHENRARLVDALKDLCAREKIGARTELIYDLGDDPTSLADTTFREFATQFGKVGARVGRAPRRAKCFPIACGRKVRRWEVRRTG